MVSQWTFVKDGNLLSHLFEPRFICNNVEGVEVCVRPERAGTTNKADIHSELATGELVEISLSDADCHMLAIWALFPTKRYLPCRVTVFLDALKSSLKRLMS